ncbi:ABC transporter ATP-binding protein [Brevibacterium casei]|uniref:ABC transporter ATP-binding protein n=2 Tax=Brevibacterium casei TaxID=33889 RepID=A0A449DA23_9MICO|nr:ABC transporter ATP-binding protein [Brevibacterium casei]MCT1448001.1 ABC transporter ATP-binding protein/permease [Brevibacterium casei]MCT1550081.1 ABC transporter ATP-binding protein/permease [Brevibacterium casei]MCT1559236.1 ABC transporter ATP-binding protein/permease [Brevibacterium casei]MCT1767045.1 ABC transporter ATP-binding protein/permease [Brevibacterium casei]MCT2208027.1 ABC transporter ATP-binding protein/permease [Brevibacterium casei]
MSAPKPAQDDEVESLPPDIARKARALLYSLVRPHLPMAVFLFVIVVATAITLVIGPLFIADALDTGIPRAVDGDPGPLTRAITLFVAAAVGSAVLSFTATRLVGITAQKIVFTLRERVFTHVQRLDLGYHERSTSGRLVSRQTSDMESVQQFLSYSLFETALAVLQMGFIAVTLVVLDVPLAIVVFAGFVPLFFITKSAHSTQRAAYRRTRTSIAKVIVHFVETMGGIRAVQAYRRQPDRRGTLSDQDSAYRDANTDALRGVAWFAGWTRLIGNVTQTVIIVVGAWLVIEGWTQIGVLAAFILYLRRFYGPLDELVQFFNLYQSASAALEKIAAVLDTEPGVPAPKTPVHLPARAGTTASAGDGAGATASAGTAAATTGRSIEITDVRFAYADGPDVLPRFDLTIPAGQIVALVGATGAGKSTLVKLVTRFYDPSEGTVSLDEVDLRDLDDAELRSSVVMVTQESFLFAGTIADNIRIGNPEATDAEVVAAATAVGLDAYIRRLPDGYDTDVKKRGGRLSSGQRQLVSFARVFLADPDVVVLDEATAHLDIPSERLVQKALATVLEGRTAIIIAHRLSTVEIADRVLVMDAGRIVEDGTPDELIAGTGRFAALHRAWRDTLV